MENTLLQHAPQDVVKALLIGFGVGSQPIAYAQWPILVDMEPDEPDNCITVIGTDGVMDGRLMPTGEQLEHFGIMLRVRAATTTGTGHTLHAFQVAFNKIKSIVEILDKTVVRTTLALTDIAQGDADYMIHCANRTSSIMNLGRQRGSKERYVFTVNYLFSIVQVI